MEIRYASLDDIPLIQQLAHATWKSAYSHILSPAQLSYMLELIYSYDSLQKQIVEQGHRFIILYDKEHEALTPVGFASFSKKMHTEPIVYRLHKIYILPSRKGTGAGKFLLQYVLAVIKKEGAAYLELNVNRQNDAQYFYHKMGFEIMKEEDIDIGNGFFMNDYVMQYKVD